MTIFTGIVLYLMLYWLCLFMVLPWGNKPPESVTVGHSTGAPANPRIKQKFIITSFVAAVVWALVFFLIKIDILDFYEISRQMSEEDRAR